MQDEQLQAIQKHLTRIEKKVDGANNRLDEMNGTVYEHGATLRHHDQTLYGHDGKGGLRDSFQRLWQRIDSVVEKVSHMSGSVEGRSVTVRTTWTAIMALGGIAAVIVALVVGLT